MRISLIVESLFKLIVDGEKQRCLAPFRMERDGFILPGGREWMSGAMFKSYMRLAQVLISIDHAHR